MDCYKCLRVCHVKAIDVHDGRAEINVSRCVKCGQCVLACPQQAKKFRDDLDTVKALIAAGETVAVSLAPSWRGAVGLRAGEIVSALKSLGVALVGETALGAESVSMTVARELNRAGPGLYVSSCCPVVVDYVRMYKPAFLGSVLPLATPALTHARLLKDHYGEGLKVVFVGPCVAKKGEADLHPDLLAAALTFGELKSWFGECPPGDGKGDGKADGNGFWPADPFEGALYALSGGMIEGLNKAGLSRDVLTVNVNTLELLGKALDDLAETRPERPIFVEAMACAGGCVTGPAIFADRSAVLAMADTLRHAKSREVAEPGPFYTNLPAVFPAMPVAKASHPFDELQEVMAQLGKRHPEDEINCSGCGYPSCRELAGAILDGLAEPMMCVSNMRKLATRKAAALLNTMPSAIVMVDRLMKVIEVNEAFVRLFAGEQAERYLGRLEDLVGTPVGMWVEFGGLIRKALKTGEDIHVEHRLYKGKLFNLSIFSVVKHQVAGAIVTDMTSLHEGRKALARKVREVINKNITTVQEIACLLGEHMVETETILSAVAEYEEGNDPDTLGEALTADGHGETNGAANGLTKAVAKGG
jgi:iron only hydrogenase large subunit-like protein